MMRARSLSLPTRLDPLTPVNEGTTEEASGFTLIELLVSMTVLVVIVGLLAQLVSNTSLSILHSTRGMDNIQLSTVALDRIGNSLAGMVTSGMGTLVVYKNAKGNDGLAMITNGRVRSRAKSSGTGGVNDDNISVSSFTDIRMGARGFCVINTQDPNRSSSDLVPMLSWGDGTVVWSTTNDGTAVQGDPTKALSLAAQDVVTPPNSPSTTGTMLDFTPLSRNIFRFETVFLLSDGTTVSGSLTGNNKLALLPGLTNGSDTPLPRNRYFVPSEVFTTPPVAFPANTYPLAFSATNSDVAPNNNSNGQNVYVRAVIVGIVSLDATTQKILTSNQLAQLASLQTFPKVDDGKTPAQAWSLSAPNATTYQRIAPPNFPGPVLQNIRVTQRYYYVN